MIKRARESSNTGAALGKKRNESAPFTLEDILLEIAFWVLLTQVMATAIYFTGKFSNPQVHKELIAEFCAAAAVGLWFAAQAVRGEIRIRFTAYYVPLILLILWSAFRTLTSPTPLSTRKFMLVAQVLVALPVWVDLLESRRRRTLLVWGIFLTGCVIGGAALLESFGYYPYPLTPGDYHRQRLGSFLGHNNPMAAYLLIGSVYGIGLAMRFRDRPWSKIFYIILAVNLYLFVLSGSRGAWISFPFAVAALFLGIFGFRVPRVDPQTARKVILPVLVCIGLGVVAVVAYNLVALDPDTPSFMDRIYDLKFAYAGTYPRTWTMSLKMFAENPLSGVGFAAWSFKYPFAQGDWFTEYPDTSLGLPGVGQHTMRAHSDYLQLVAELGVPGLLLLLWLLICHVREVWQFISNDRRSEFAILGLAAMTATMAHALVFFPFHEAAASCPFLAAWALFIVSRRGDAAITKNFSPKIGGDTEGVELTKHSSPDRLLQFSGPNIRWITALAAIFFLLFALRPVGRFVTADTLSSQMSIELPKGQTSKLGWGYKAGAVVWENWATTYESEGKYDLAFSALQEAKFALEKSLELDPSFPQISYQYASLCFRYADLKYRIEKKTDAYQQAMEAIERSLKVYTWHGSFHLLAQCARVLWKETGDERYYHIAVRNHEQGLRNYPLNFPEIANLGKLYYDNGETQKTIDLFFNNYARFKEFQGDFLALLSERGRVAWVERRSTDADFYLTMCSALDSQNGERRYSLALFFLEYKRFDAVLRALKEHLQVQPDEMQLMPRLFDVWIRNGDPQQAVETAIQLFLGTDYSPAMHSHLRAITATFLLKREYEQADRLLAGLPDSYTVQVRKDRALTQWLKGDPLGATSNWTLWLQEHAGDADAKAGIMATFFLLSPQG